MSPVGAAAPPLRATATIRAADVRLATLGVIQAGSHASTPTTQPVSAAPPPPGEPRLRRVPAQILDIRV